ncbi:hypothetical protein ACGFYZ_35465 [Streptomyces sp. NPDC048330]|uniref:hypothetical protein n=1 Tax=Streptomyces sp. NPDC048330 TaxID=3365533 RepID=UPI00371AB63E
MLGNADGRVVRELADMEFRALMEEAQAEARRVSLGRPPEAESAFALRAQHAEFGAAAH